MLKLNVKLNQKKVVLDDKTVTTKGSMESWNVSRCGKNQKKGSKTSFLCHGNGAMYITYIIKEDKTGIQCLYPRKKHGQNDILFLTMNTILSVQSVNAMCP